MASRATIKLLGLASAAERGPINRPDQIEIPFHGLQRLPLQVPDHEMQPRCRTMRTHIRAETSMNCGVTGLSDFLRLSMSDQA